MARPDLLLLVGVTALLIIVGDSLILERHQGAPGSWLDLARGDAPQYLAMVDDRPATLPYADRVLVPAVAGLLPFSAETALKTENLASLAVLYLTGGLLLVILGFRSRTAALSLVVVWSTVSHLFAYQNPYLVDTPATAAMTGVLVAAVVGANVSFVALLVAAVLMRETALAMVPLGFTDRHRLVGVAGVTAAVIAFAAPRLDDAGRLGEAMLRPEVDLVLVAKVVLSYGYLWLPAVAGLLLYRGPKRRLILVAAVSLATVAAATSFVAIDVPRLIGITFPVALIGIAVVLDAAPRWAALVAASYTGIGVLATFPTLRPSGSPSGSPSSTSGTGTSPPWSWCTRRSASSSTAGSPGTRGARLAPRSPQRLSPTGRRSTTPLRSWGRQPDS